MMPLLGRCCIYVGVRYTLYETKVLDGDASGHVHNMDGSGTHTTISFLVCCKHDVHVAGHYAIACPPCHIS